MISLTLLIALAAAAGADAPDDLVAPARSGASSPDAALPPQAAPPSARFVPIGPTPRDPDERREESAPPQEATPPPPQEATPPAPHLAPRPIGQRAPLLQLVVDVPAVFDLLPTVSLRNTEAFGGSGPRVGLRVRAPMGLILGADVALLARRSHAGTAVVSSSRSAVEIDGRLYAGYRLGAHHTALTPYVFTGTSGGVGFAQLEVGKDGRRSLFGAYTARAGVGARVSWWGLFIRADLAGGVRNLQPTLFGTCALGYAFTLL